MPKSKEKKIIQILANGAKHFVTTHFDPVSNKAIVFDSLGMHATKQLRKQIFRLYCIAGSKVEVEVPKMQKQSYSSNNCSAFATAYMVDLCDQRSVFGALYVDSQSQRNWLIHVFETGVLLPCPRLALKPARPAETNPPEPKFFCSE